MKLLNGSYVFNIFNVTCFLLETIRPNGRAGTSFAALSFDTLFLFSFFSSLFRNPFSDDFPEDDSFYFFSSVLEFSRRASCTCSSRQSRGRGSDGSRGLPSPAVRGLRVPDASGHRGRDPATRAAAADPSPARCFLLCDYILANLAMLEVMAILTQAPQY